MATTGGLWMCAVERSSTGEVAVGHGTCRSMASNWFEFP